MKLLLLFIFLPFMASAQFGVFAGFADSQLEQSILTYSVGGEYAFTSEKGFSISTRLSLSERGGKIDGIETKTKVIGMAYILRQDLDIDKNSNAILFPLAGVQFDRLKLQGKGLQSSIVMPLGLGVKFGKVSAWFEYQLNLTGDYTASGLNLGYSF